MVYFHGFRGITYTKADFKFSFEYSVEFSTGENEEIICPVVDMGIIHNTDFIGDEETGSERDTRNHLIGIKEIHSRLGVTVPVIFIVRLYEWIELFIELTQFKPPEMQY
jgi:hypothetical protein